MLRTNTTGIFPSDIIIRSALQAALDDLRENPWQLDYVFAGIVNDDLTKQTYGEAEFEEARNWFLRTDIPVSMAFRIDQPQTPMIAISLEDGSEGAATLGDIHSAPYEETDVEEIITKPSAIVARFTPQKYDPTTGYVTLPTSTTTADVFAGMVICDTSANKSYSILEVIDSQTIKIAVGTKANFTNAVIAPADSIYQVALRSVEERESYRIDLYVSGNSLFLLYLYAVVKFCLYKYKQTYLEARGFERSTFTSTGLRLFAPTQKTDIIYTRGFTLTGYVRQYWPHEISPKIQGIVSSMVVKDGPATPDSFKTQTEDQGWGMDDDSDGIGQP